MKNVIKRLKQEEQDCLEKAETIGKAIDILTDGEPEFDITENLEGAGLPEREPTEIKPLWQPRLPSSLARGTLRDEILTVIDESGPICSNDVAEKLMTKFEGSYGNRSYTSVRSSVSGSLTFLRTLKPKIRNLKWEKEGKSYFYWFEGKR